MKRLKELSTTLGIFTEMPTCYENGDIFIHSSFGLVIDKLAARYTRVLLCTATFHHLEEYHASGRVSDYVLSANNVEMVSQPAFVSTVEALKHPSAIAAAYARTLNEAGHIFVRGMLPYSSVFYFLAVLYGRKPVHWIVGNPVALLRTHQRFSKFKNLSALTYAYVDRYVNCLGRWLTGGAFICNGDELAGLYISPRTHSVISSSITENDFFYRDDTCQGNEIRLLFVGFIRPEKGLEYLLTALPKLQCGRPWRLTIVGSWDTHKDYKEKLDLQIQKLGIGNRVEWKGYVLSGPAIWEYMRQNDIFVFPTLSEGTPRVLVEARANSLPIVSTNVGGIPTSLRGGLDSLLVPPKDSDAISTAIDLIVEQSDLRRNLIRSGLESVKEKTVDCFVQKIFTVMEQRD